MEREYVCCLCFKKFKGYGNSPYPIYKDEKHECCDKCNMESVVPIRLKYLTKGNESRK